MSTKDSTTQGLSALYTLNRCKQKLSVLLKGDLVEEGSNANGV